jgi:lipopolysaccharide biosynthesis glycosyltransferase
MTSKNLRQEYFTKINSLMEKQGKDISNVTYYNMGDDFKGAITGTHISTAAYYRIALPSLLPYVDKIIYTDTDVLNFCDLSEMYSLEFKDKMYFMGTLDQIGLLNELKSLGIITKKYMNSGILLMNLKGMRKDGIEQKIRKYIFSHYLDHHDQTAINGACYENYEILSFKYATFNFKSFENMVEWNNKQDKLYRYNDLELRQGFYEPRLLHFAGWTKPWDKKWKNINGEYWWYYAKKSGFYDEILRAYGFSKDVIEKKLEKIPEDGGLMKRNYKKKE